MDDVTLILSILGALAWLPTIIDFLMKPILKAKLIGLYCLAESEYTPGSILSSPKSTIKGTTFILRLSLQSIKKDFNISSIRVAVKTSDYETEVEATPYYCPYVKEKKGSEERRLCLKYEENILFYSNFLKNQRIIGDIMFITDIDVNTSNFEYFNIEFYDNETMQSIILKGEEVSNSIKVFNDNIE